MASTLTETYRAEPVGHLPPTERKLEQPELATANTTFKTPSKPPTPGDSPSSRTSVNSTQQAASAQDNTSLSQIGLSSLAVAAMAGGRMDNSNAHQHGGQFNGMGASNNGNGNSNHGQGGSYQQSRGPAPTPTSVANNGQQQGTVPTCQNCTTSTTPLWRRDEIGSVLCNACGLFLKLHGRPRPISLKTDVIKSRNRVKTSGLGQQKKKSLFDQNGLGDPNAQLHHNAQQHNALNQRRPSQRSQNGQSDGSHSPISRTGTPNMYGNHMNAFNNDLVDHQFHNASLAGAMNMGRATSPGRSETSMNGNLDMPQTFEQLIATNSSLKTRVSELEVINELFRGRVTQLEQDEANARRGEEMRRESERNLRLHLEESQRRENQLKRRLDDLERELGELRERDSMELTHKKPRLDDGAGAVDPSLSEMVGSLDPIEDVEDVKPELDQSLQDPLLTDLNVDSLPEI